MAKFNVFLAVVALALGVASAITDDEKKALKEVMTPIFLSCGDEFGISKEDIIAAKKSGDISALKDCFYACILKKIGFINEAGFFDPDVALEKNKKYFKDEEDLKNMAEIGKICTSVNEQTVTDGAKACERAKLLVSCFIKEKANFTPFSQE